MIRRLYITLILIITACVVLTLLFIIRRRLRPRRRSDFAVPDGERGRNLHNGSARMHQVSPHHHQLDRDSSKKANYHLFRRGPSTKQAFSWVDHPSFVTDAVENGWSRFAFAVFMSSPSVKSTRSLLGSCAAADHGDENGVEIGWEVCEGSADFMQKVRLNPDVKKVAANISGSSMAAAAVIRTALPLPGPNLGDSSFPQEAYFEITIVSLNENARDEMCRMEKKESWEGEKLKLIDEDFNAKNSPELLSEAASSDSQRRSKVEEVKMGENEAVLVCVGLTGGNPLPFRIPGSFPASIGFNSTGSVYLDGTKLVSNSDNEDWGRPDKVVGCGYSPGQKKVFFTVDSQMVHEIHCNSQHFCSPLYPTLAANADVVVLVNLGQCPFRFAPANLQRTPNPCFVGPPAASPANTIGYYEDSRELFSMGRFDSPTRFNNTLNSIKSMEEYEQEFEGDLFEIVLDTTTGRSPFTTLNLHLPTVCN